MSPMSDSSSREHMGMSDISGTLDTSDMRWHFRLIRYVRYAGYRPVKIDFTSSPKPMWPHR